MKALVFSAPLALVAMPVLAHPGHAALVDGHTHTLVDLALMGAVPAIALIGGIALVRAILRGGKAHSDD